MTLAESAQVASLAETVRLALDCLPDPTLVIDARDVVSYANKAFERLTGYSAAEVEGLRLAALKQQGGPVGISLFRCKPGGVATAAVAVKPLAGELGVRYRMVRLDQEPTRRSVVSELAAGLDIRSEFMSRVSHELRTPLTALQEGIDVVLDGFAGPLNERQVEFLELARRNVRRLVRLVQDTLELGELKNVTIPRPLAPTNLERLVRECASRYQDARYEPGPPVWAEIDEPRVRDALERLIQNGIRHSKSSIRVSLRCEDGGATVAVSDTGPGIPKDKLECIFDEFEQLSVGPGRTVGGVGLGLSIVKLVIEQHGGRVWAQSEPGQGCCFCFTLKTCSAPVEVDHENRDSG